jgi:hypothetical protein
VTWFDYIARLSHWRGRGSFTFSYEDYLPSRRLEERWGCTIKHPMLGIQTIEYRYVPVVYIISTGIPFGKKNNYVALLSGLFYNT